MARILVTGATGLIGSHLIRCFGPDDVVFALSRSGATPGAAQTIPIDLALPWSIEDLPPDVDAVVHLAQSERYRDFPHSAENVFTVNTLSTVKLLDYARKTGVRRFVLASSGGVYGSGRESFTESTTIPATGDLGFYIGTRLCSELLSDSYRDYMNVICLRFFFAYGPGQRAQMLVPRLIDSVRSGRAVRLSGVNGLRLNPIYVDDAVESVRRALMLDGSHKLNVAGPHVHSLRAIVNRIGQLLDLTPVFEIGQPEAPEQDLVADISRMGELLWTPRVSFDDGAATMLDPNRL